jgi:hypothetical protein
MTGPHSLKPDRVVKAFERAGWTNRGQRGSHVTTLPPVAYSPEPETWLNDKAFMPFLQEVRSERLAEVERIATHVELSLTELLQKADEEIGRAATEMEQKITGAAGEP